MTSVESALVQFIHSFVGVSAVLDWFAVFFATYFPYLLGLFSLFLMFRWGTLKERFERLVYTALIVVLGRGFISELFYFFATRPRPYVELGFTPLFQETGSAFPSRHAVILFSLAAMMFTVKRSYGWWFTAFAVVVGIARVYAGVHYPSDIVGGAVVAFASFFIARMLINLHQKNISKSKDAEGEVSVNEESQVA